MKRQHRKGCIYAIVAVCIALLVGKILIDRIVSDGNYGYAQSSVRQIALSAIYFAGKNEGLLPASIEELVENGYLAETTYTHDGIPNYRAIEFPRLVQPPGTRIEDLPKDAVLVYWQWNETKAARAAVDGSILP